MKISVGPQAVTILSLNSMKSNLGSYVSLVHKFGLSDDEEAEVDIDDITSKLPTDFAPKGKALCLCG